MPELPEIQTIVNGLKSLLVGKQIVTLEYDYANSFPNDAALTEKAVYLARLRNVKRRGKVILLDLDSGYTLMTHLKMTGQLVYDDGNNTVSQLFPDSTTRIICGFSDGTRLYFNDQRKFGWMKICPTDQLEEEKLLRSLGPNPLDKTLTGKQLQLRLRRKSKSSIKAALLDQTVLSGLGNIYVDESLFLAGIHPLRRTESLNDQEINKLLRVIRSVLRKALQSGGSSRRNYLNAQGERGTYLNHAYVYERKGQPCRRCKTKIEKIRVAGRGTHFCPNCQSLPGHPYNQA